MSQILRHYPTGVMSVAEPHVLPCCLWLVLHCLLNNALVMGQGISLHALRARARAAGQKTSVDGLLTEA